MLEIRAVSKTFNPGTPNELRALQAIDLKASIKSLFEGQSLEGILHLLSDDRALSGSGQSELVRGACWVAPISNIAVERAPA